MEKYVHRRSDRREHQHAAQIFPGADPTVICRQFP